MMRRVLRAIWKPFSLTCGKTGLEALHDCRRLLNGP
jgi:hypothetical protein